MTVIRFGEKTVGLFADRTVRSWTTTEKNPTDITIIAEDIIELVGHTDGHNFVVKTSDGIVYYYDIKCDHPTNVTELLPIEAENRPVSSMGILSSRDSFGVNKLIMVVANSLYHFRNSQGRIKIAHCSLIASFDANIDLISIEDETIIFRTTDNRFYICSQSRQQGDVFIVHEYDLFYLWLHDVLEGARASVNVSKLPEQLTSNIVSIVRDDNRLIALMTDGAVYIAIIDVNNSKITVMSRVIFPDGSPGNISKIILSNFGNLLITADGKFWMVPNKMKDGYYRAQSFGNKPLRNIVSFSINAYRNSATFYSYDDNSSSIILSTPLQTGCFRNLSRDLQIDGIENEQISGAHIVGSLSYREFGYEGDIPAQILLVTTSGSIFVAVPMLGAKSKEKIKELHAIRLSYFDENPILPISGLVPLPLKSARTVIKSDN